MRDYKELISQLTFEEKASLLTEGDVDAKTAEIERLGIKSITVSDGPSGLRYAQGKKVPGGDVAFASGISMGATWNRELINEVGHEMGKNCIAEDVDILLAPSVNLQRNPLCGRNFEYFSEDPVLAGELAASFINGIEDEGVGSNLKHFALNSQERFRRVFNANCDERTLRELYLRVFEIVIKKSNPSTVMCAYNKVNGPYCAENKWLLTDVLRNEWGYKGQVMSDWGAVYNVSKSIKAGLDLQMPRNRKICEDLKKGLENGWCTMEDIDRAVENNLRLVDKLVNFERTKEPFDRAKAHEVAREAATEGVVMLKNKDNILPLNKRKDVKRIVVFGKYAEQPYAFSPIETSAGVTCDDESIDKPLDYIRKYAEELGMEVDYDPLYDYESGAYGIPLRARMIDKLAKADAAIFFLGNHPYYDVEGEDRLDLKLPFNMSRLASEVARLCPDKSIMVQQQGCVIENYDYLGTPAAILQSWMAGEGGGKAIADIIFGKVSPSGKLPITFMKELDPRLEWRGDGVKLDYAERLEIGYRYYDKHPEMVNYPFGFGMSYTTFEYSNLKLSNTKSTDPKAPLTVSFDITNTGDMVGKEAAQLYVSPKASSMVVPIKTLEGFDKVELQPGETKTVTINLDSRAFSYWNIGEKDWHVESGEYEIMIGASSTDIRLSATYEIEDNSDYSVARERWDEHWEAKLILGMN